MLPSGQIQGTYMSSPVSVNAGQTVSAGFQLYFGPRDLGILKELGLKLERAVYFGWTDIIAKPLLYVLWFFNEYLHNYGISIILLTILIKILFWPLTHKSYKSMKEMQKLQPRMAKLREKYKDNREQMNKELMGLYKTYKVNPMGGCLPMVIQIPVFFALFRILGDSIELRHAPFFLWINDLSAPDRLFQFPFSIPFMSPPYGIPMLTLLMGASMFLQQKMTPTPGDPTQAKIMMFLPIIFTFMFVNFSSGLVLYWLVNNILSIGQQYRVNKSRT
jgi:YidC/Oxa1 family membrane protein insertase